MHTQKQKNARITNHNNAPNISVGSSNTITKRRLVDPQFEALLGSAKRKQTTITKAFEISLAKPHNTTKQAISNKTITKVIVMQNLLLFFTEEKMFKCFTKIHNLHQAETVLLTVDLWIAYLHKGYLADAITKCIEDVLEYWDLKTKVFSITSNSRANMKSACNKLDNISVFDLEEVSDENEEFEQIRSLAATTNLVECIKNIMSELFERLEYDQIISDEDLGSLSSKAALDLSGSFISTVFTVVQQNATYKNEVD
ncbi:17363_t:CDS:2 [Gigaspora margarita]|uniref:17363_t:CDS:1 n=1 Tax=Gigaspora margarita TaxID=4874 RepID=A0ABN7UCN1_GIGMA|nr:17363_t:CDS:2 [Gigaspora margarita]